MEKALYFYSIRVQESSFYRLIDGTVEVSPKLTTCKQFNEVRDSIFKDLELENSNAVFTSFNML